MMEQTEKLVTGPAKEPLATDQLRHHLRVDIRDDDTYLDNLVIAARRYFEGTTKRALITQTWRANLEAWPDENEISLPRPPLQSVTSLVYKDAAGDPTTWDASNYIVDTDSEPGRIVLASDASWPSLTLYPVNPITVTFVAGFGDDSSDIPEQMKLCLQMLVGHWYENREPISFGTPKMIPFTIESLIWLNRFF